MIHESKIQFTSRTHAQALLLLEQVLGSKLFGRLAGGHKRRFLEKLAVRMAEMPAPEKTLVDRREDLDAGEFRDWYFDLSRPVIFSGAAKNWPCVNKWNLDYFSLAHGENDLLIVEATGLTNRKNSSEHEFLTVRQLVQNIKAGGDKYLRFSPLLHENPELTSDLDMKWLSRMRGGNTFGNTYYMFMGGAGRKTYLHADQPCNLYVQICGEKRWTLYYPEDSVCLYPEVTNTAYVKSPIDIDNPDTARFPLFRHAKAYEAHLRPGDVLYVPPHVWHHVENLTDTIAVGYRFSSLKAAMMSSVTFTLLRLLCTNPPLWKTREYGKIDTNLIWAHTAGKIKDVLNQRERRQALRSSSKNEDIQL